MPLTSDKKLTAALIFNLAIVVILLLPLVFKPTTATIEISPRYVPLNQEYTLKVEYPESLQEMKVCVIYAPTDKVMLCKSFSGNKAMIKEKASEGRYSIGLYVVKVSSGGKEIGERTFSVIWGANLTVEAYSQPSDLKEVNGTVEGIAVVRVLLHDGTPAKGATVWAFPRSGSIKVTPFSAETNSSGIAVFKWKGVNLTAGSYVIAFTVGKPGHHIAEAKTVIKVEKD